MPVIGVAQVHVVPSFKDFQKSVGKEIDGAAGSPQIKKSGGRIGSMLKGAAVAGVAGTGALLGTALTKGFGRLTAIENARGKLVGLGHDAKSVETIMTNATASVKGTAFGLDEAATVAANAVAAGVKPGKDLERTLKLVADASTIAGTDMASMGAIFNKAAASNKVQMDIINQLHDAGVPALSLIAEQMGVTAEEASKMASKGEVDFATFQAAMEKGLGGAALESGKTLQGALKNSMAAIGRFGANLLEGVYPKLREFFQGFIEWMGPVEELGKAIGEKLGVALEQFIGWIQDRAVPAMRGFADWVRENHKPILAIGSAVVGLMAGLAAYKAITGLVGWIKGVAGAMTALNAVMAANPVGIVIAALGALVGAAIWAYNEIDWFREMVDGAWAGITKAVKSAWEGYIKPAMDSLARIWREVVGPALDFLWNQIIVPAWKAIGSVIHGAWTRDIQPALESFFRMVSITLGPEIERFWNEVAIPAFKAIAGAVSNMWREVEPKLRAFADFVDTRLGPALEILYAAKVKPSMENTGKAVQGMWLFKVMPSLKAWNDAMVNIGPVITALYHARVKPTFERMGRSISGFWDGASKIFGWFQDRVGNSLPEAISKGVGRMAGAFGALKQKFAAPINWVIDNVFNRGLIPVFNKISGAVGGPQIGEVARVATGTTLGKGNSKGTGGITTVGRRAQGGPVRAGQPYIVGELGKELVFPDRDGYVATARETEKILRANKDLTPEQSQIAAGRRPSDALVPMGGGIGSALAGGAAWLAGQLAQGARKVIDPIMGALSGQMARFGLMGQLGLSAARKAVSLVLGWAGKKDKEFTEGGMFGGTFAGAPGRFHRPSRGPITSWFGPRWGTTHAGVDIAGGGPTYAAWNGVVQKTGNNIIPGRTGLGILLNHGKSLWSYYGHNPVGGIRVRPGQEVKAGQHIGYQGNTGNVYKGGPGKGIHVHFEANRGAPGRLTNINALFRDNGGELPRGLSMILNNRRESEWIVNKPQIDQMAANFMARGQGPQMVALVLEDGTSFPAYVQDQAEARFTHMARGTRQFARQMTGA